MIWIWYPARVGHAMHPAEYVPGRWGHKAAKWEAFDMRLRSGPLWSGPLWSVLFRSPISASSFEHARVHAVDDAPLADALPAEHQKYPVLLFEPGLGKMGARQPKTRTNNSIFGFKISGSFCSGFRLQQPI